MNTTNNISTNHSSASEKPMKSRHNSQTLSNRADRLGLVLQTASRETVMDALSQNEPRPRWELSDGKHRSSVRSFLTLSEVSDELDWREER